jgi:hypothetical protein
VEAGSLLCYWAVRELGHGATDIAKRLSMTQPAVGYTVNRGEQMARERKIILVLWIIHLFMDVPYTIWTSLTLIQLDFKTSLMQYNGIKITVSLYSLFEIVKSVYLSLKS